MTSSDSRSLSPRRRSSIASLGAALWLLVATTEATAVAADTVQSVPFVRGDANASGTVDLTDGLAVLLHLFAGEALPPCPEAANVNADSSLDLGDPVLLLSHLFLGLAPPPPPFPECGFAATDPALPCARFAPCDAYFALETEPESPGPSMTPIVLTTFGGDAAVQVGPDLFRALELLEPGESVFALRAVPGFDEYLEQSVALAPVRAGEVAMADFVPSVEIRGELSPEEPCYELSEGVLRKVTEVMKKAGVIGDTSHIVAAVPLEICEAGTTPVLLIEEKPDGKRGLRSCDLKLTESGDPTEEEEAEGPEHIRIPQRKKPAEPSSGPHCEWLTMKYVTDPDRESKDGRDRSWNLLGYAVEERRGYHGGEPGFGVGADGWMTLAGGGPWHELLAERRKANCHAPETTLSKPMQGELSTEIGIRCYRTDKKQESCKATVACEGLYSSEASVSSKAGWWCSAFGANDVEAIAQDEASFTVNEEQLFNKALVLSNGNNVTSEISYGLGANVAHSAKEGAASRVDARFGYTEKVVHDTGLREDLLVCKAMTPAAAVPVSLRLQSQGKVEVNAYHSTNGAALVRTRVCGIYFAAETDCGGAGAFAGGYLIGVPETRKKAQEKATDFIRARGYDGPLVWRPTDEAE